MLKRELAGNSQSSANNIYSNYNCFKLYLNYRNYNQLHFFKQYIDLPSRKRYLNLLSKQFNSRFNTNIQSPSGHDSPAPQIWTPANSTSLFPSTTSRSLRVSTSPTTQYNFSSSHLTITPQVEKQYDLRTQNENSILRALDNIERQVLNDCTTISSHNNFDPIYFAVKFLQPNHSGPTTQPSPKVAQKLADCLCHILNNTLKRVSKIHEGQSDIPEIRVSFKMIVFLAFFFMEATLIKKKVDKGDMIAQAINKENKKKRKKQDQQNSNTVTQGFKFLEDRQKSIIQNIRKSLNLDFKLLWQRREIDQDFFKYYSDLGMRVLESPVGKNEDVRADVFQIFEIVLKDSPERLKKVQISLIYLLFEQDVVDNLVQFFSKAESPEMQRLCIETLVLTIAHLISKNNANAESQAIKNTKEFLSRLSEVNPKIFFNNLNCFIKLYDNQSYLLRNAISDILFNIIRKVMTSDSEQSVKTKEKYINTLVRRIHDKHTHCRGYILNLLAQLTRQNLVPKNSLQIFLAAGVDRLRDLGVHTRKRAIQLITEVLNIYRYIFDNKVFKTREQLMAEIESNDQEEKSYASELDDLINKSKEAADESTLEVLSKEIKLARKKISDCEMNRENYHEYLRVLEKIKEVSEVLAVLLASKNFSDVAETIKLFVFLKEAGIQGLEESLSKINMLIFSKEKGVKEEVENCFITLYLKNSREAADNLVRLFSIGTLQDITCLEEIMENLLKQNSIGKHNVPPGTFQILWERFFKSMKASIDDPTLKVERRACLAILRVGFACEPKILRDNYVATLIDVLKKYNETRYPDFIIIREINKIAQKCSQQLGLDTKTLIMSTIGILIREQQTDDMEWYSACEQLLTTIFSSCEFPEQYSELLINQLHKRLVEKNTQPALAKFIYCLSHSSLKLLIHLDALQLKLKAIRQEAEKSKGGNDDSELEKIVGGIEGEFEARIQKLHSLADDIVNDPFISRWLRIIQNIVVVSNGSSELQRSAVLAYCKFNCISENYCCKNMNKIFQLLMKPNLDPVIKNNIIISIGDLLHRFPNAVEPHSRFLYQNLHDKNPRVRKTAMIVLTHLILNSMVRLKGEICDFALLFEDENPQIQNLTRLFFNEINRKDPRFLYNHLPDAITRLSSLEQGLCGVPITEKTFDLFAKNILVLLEKDKLSESLIDKLTQRFGTVSNIIELRNTANVLCQLNYNEKGLRKLIENFEYIRPKLTDFDIANYFRALLTRVTTRVFTCIFIKKTPKLVAQNKALVEQLESKLGSVSEEVYDVEAVRRRNERQPAKKKKQPKKKSSKAAPSQAMVEESSSDEDQPVFVAPAAAEPRRELRARRGRQPIIVQSDESDSEQDNY